MFGGVAKTILPKASSFASEVHLVFDKYGEGPSIKGYEHDERWDSTAFCKVTGPFQRRPADFRVALRSNTFKTELLDFLIREWKVPDYASVLEGRTIYFAVGQYCVVYSSTQGQVQSRDVEEFRSTAGVLRVHRL